MNAGNWNRDAVAAAVCSPLPSPGRGLSDTNGLSELQKDNGPSGVGIGLVSTRHGVDRLPSVVA